jgi:hypothetical protein
MPGAWNFHETPAVQSLAASPPATQNQSSDQHYTMQQSGNARAALHNSTAQESTPTIEGDILQSSELHRLKQRFKLMSLALDGTSGGDEEDEDDEAEDDEEDRDENELVVFTPDPNNPSSGSDQVEMRGLSFDEALTIAIDWEAFEVEKDNVANVSARPRKWVSALMRAFVAPYSTKPTLVDFEEISKEDFLTWQKIHAEKARKRLSSNVELREALAILLFDMVIQLHEARKALVCHGNSRRILDVSLTCSKRLRLVIAAIEKLPIVRWDVTTRQRLWDLIHSPINMVKFKEDNKRLNIRKMRKYQHLRSHGGTKKSDWDPMNSEADNAGKLLENCTSLAGVESDTDEEDAPRIQATGAEHADAPVGENEDED